MATATQRFNGTYELDPVHSTIEFAVRHLTVSTFRASFADVEARLQFDNDAIALEARALVESISIVDPPEFREHVVRGPDFFDADAHPAITFRSTSVELSDDGTACIDGALTIRGITRSVRAHGTYQLPTQDPFGKQRAGLELRTTINRSNWGLSWQVPLPAGGDALGWDVEITVQLELIKTA